MTHGSKKKSQGNLEGNFNFVYFIMNYNKMDLNQNVCHSQVNNIVPLHRRHLEEPDAGNW